MNNLSEKQTLNKKTSGKGSKKPIGQDTVELEMKFFIISYFYRLEDGVSGPGEIAWICNPYPIREFVIARAQKDFRSKISSLAILNIIEVTKEQFETYIQPYDQVRQKQEDQASGVL